MKKTVVATLVSVSAIGIAAPAHADENAYLQQVSSTTSRLFSASSSQLLQLGYVACQAFGGGPHTPQTSLQADDAVARAAYGMGLMTGLAGSRFITDAADDNLC
jgi:hypothetical protein